MSTKPRTLRALIKDERGSVVPFADVMTYAASERPNYEVPRKVFHMFGAIIPIVYYVSGLSQEIILGLLLPAVIMIVGADLIRLVHAGFNKFFTTRFGKLMRKGEERSLTTSTYFLLASMAVIYGFDKRIAVVSLLYLSFGDPIAALVGRKFGEIKLVDGKSLEGTLACFQTCLLIGLLLLPSPQAAVLAAVCAALAELVPLPVNDNLRIPVCSAFALYFLI